jgi:hypothetical protein
LFVLSEGLTLEPLESIVEGPEVAGVNVLEVAGVDAGVFVLSKGLMLEPLVSVVEGSETAGVDVREVAGVLRQESCCGVCLSSSADRRARPFSGISRTILDTQLDNLPNRMGQRSPAGIIL